MIKIKNKKIVFVMMSGGVDSSVAAFLLAKNKNYEVVGCFIKGYNVDGCQERDAEDARRTAEYLKIPFYAIDLENEYKKLVVDYMIDGYRRGITPNPDVMCNKEIKFGLFFKKALAMGADYVATGHYVRLWRTQLTTDNKQLTIKKQSISQVSDVRCQMFIAKDKNKDQSYFLWTLTQEQLKHCLFPIGDYLKSEVRGIAKKAGLPTAEKKDSQGICFLGTVNFKDFLKQYLSVKKGDILIALPARRNFNEGGIGAKKEVVYKKIGEHDGVWFYTIGQRHGIGISGENPYYVAEKNIKKNTLVVVEGENNPALYKNEIKLTYVNFIHSIADNQLPIIVYARVRYRQPLAKAELIINPRKSASKNNKSASIRFHEKQKFVAPGQSAVFYEANPSASSGLEMLGGGIIA